MLDDMSRIKKYDVNNMVSRIESMPEQLVECKDLTKDLGILTKPSSIVVAGMGASGIVGDLLSDWLSNDISIPITTNKTITLPRFVDEDTMLIALSYSGNTKETLLALEEGLERTSNVLCISSGGKMLDLCKEKELNHVKVPPGYPPRSALGYLFGSAAYALKSAGIHDRGDEVEEAASHLKWLRDMLATGQETSANPAKSIATGLKGLIPIIYAYDEMRSCAKRWQTQLNENAKVLCWSTPLPEMSHNEIVGLDADEKGEKFAMVFLRDKGEPEFARNKFEFLKRRMKNKVLEVWSEGKGRLARMMHLIYVGDFVSYYLAILRGIDPMTVEIIEEMKREVT